MTGRTRDTRAEPERTVRSEPERIDRPGNPRIAAAAALRDREQRAVTGLALVDGVREIERAIGAGLIPETIFLCPERAGERAAALAASAARRGSTVLHVSRRALERLAYGDREEGVVAVVRPRVTGLADLRLPPHPMVVVTEDVEKPGNLGAVLRAADGAGADAVVAAGGADPYHPNVIRASTGIVFSLPVACAAASEVLDWLHANRIRVVTTRLDATRSPWEVDLRGPVAIVLGSEAHGLSATWSGPDMEAVRLPMLGAADSLNVAVTAAVLLYEARRQRGAGGPGG
jgi:TrmH family RNA methyltransferase